MLGILKKSYVVLLLLFVAFAIYFIAYFAGPETRAAEQRVVIGYAWSSNIGWISLSCFNQSSDFCEETSDYEVELDLGTGEFSGYAWSSNIGWIDFAPTSGYPEAPPQSARLVNVDSSVCESERQAQGWIRALSHGGGWDGWIKMSGSTGGGGSYGVCLTEDENHLEGFAWGDKVVGWIYFDSNLNSIEKKDRREEIIPQ